MGLYGISGFLGKFSRLLRSEAAQKQVIQEALKARFGIDIEGKNVLVKDGVVTIKAHPALKQRIFMEKKALLEYLSSFLPDGVVKDIR